VVHDKDAEDAQLLEWGVEPEVEVIDLPPLPLKPAAADAPKVAAKRIGRQKKPA
jgi:non-ribosomal peptide synthetase component F